jgi:hypothetical protein
MAMTDEGLETVARWMGARGYATGHGDTIEDLLYELEGQVRELALKHPEMRWPNDPGQ